MTCEMQTANEYRHMVIMNEYEVYHKLEVAWREGNITRFFKDANAALHKIVVPWSESSIQQGVGNVPPDGNRWLPLVHELVRSFVETTGHPKDVQGYDNVHRRTEWMWANKSESLYKSYTADTPLEFLKVFSKALSASYEQTEAMIKNEEYSTVCYWILERCRRRQEYHTGGNPEKKSDMPLLSDKERLLRKRTAVQTAELMRYGRNAQVNVEEYKKNMEHVISMDLRLIESQMLADGIKIDGHFPHPSKEDNTMQPIKVEQRTFIDDVDSANVTNEQIFGYIADLEKEATTLGELTTQCDSVLTRIKELRKSARKLAKFADSR